MVFPMKGMPAPKSKPSAAKAPPPFAKKARGGKKVPPKKMPPTPMGAPGTPPMQGGPPK